MRRFDSIGLATIVTALCLASGCGEDDTASLGATTSNAGGSGNGGALQAGGTSAGGQGAGTGSKPSSSGGRGGASGSGGISAATNTGGTIGDASLGGADGSADSSSTAGGSGTGGRPGSGGAGAGGVATDASGNLCGTVTCESTRCAGWNCGAAVCCDLQSQRMCVHGTTSCPASDGGGSSATLECLGGAKDAYVFAKGCTQKSDCFVAEHWVGCCNVHALGLSTSEKSRFDSFEASCGGAPACGCCCDRVTAEDGMVVSAGTTLGVDCVAGLCKSSAP